MQQSESIWTFSPKKVKMNTMTKVRTSLLDIPELENLDLKTEQRDGKRYYIDAKGEQYPSVTTVVGLKN